MRIAKKHFIIVATTSMLADAVRMIVRDVPHTEVHGLMGPGVDPHLYRARESDVHTLAAADLIVYNGLHLEGKMGQVLEGMQRFAKTIAAADALGAEHYCAQRNLKIFMTRISGLMFHCG